MIHNHEVAGSIPAPATLKINELQRCSSFLFFFYDTNLIQNQVIGYCLKRYEIILSLQTLLKITFSLETFLSLLLLSNKRRYTAIKKDIQQFDKIQHRNVKIEILVRNYFSEMQNNYIFAAQLEDCRCRALPGSSHLPTHGG